MIAIINYGMGNLRSVKNALEAVGGDAFIAENPLELERADKIILPGVGAFGDGMINLNDGGWTHKIDEEIRGKGKIFFGICLGMQLLANLGTEHGDADGLKFVEGKSVKIKTNGNDSLRVPHIGWNDVNLQAESRLYAGMKSPQAFYFVHSYVLEPENKQFVTGVCNHGTDFAASFEKDNILSVQFHPEKSHKAGLALLKNFVNLKA